MSLSPQAAVLDVPIAQLDAVELHSECPTLCHLAVSEHRRLALAGKGNRPSPCLKNRTWQPIPALYRTTGHPHAKKSISVVLLPS